MFRKKASKPQSRIDSLIGAGTTIEGNVTFVGGLRVDGEVRGNVSASGDQPSTLVLSEQARIVVEFRADARIWSLTAVIEELSETRRRGGVEKGERDFSNLSKRSAAF